MVLFCIPIMTLMNGFISFTHIWKKLFNNAELNLLANSCLSCFPLASSWFSAGGRVNFLAKISYRVIVIITEGLSFSLVFLLQLPHYFSRDLSSAVQLWNFSSISNSSLSSTATPQYGGFFWINLAFRMCLVSLPQCISKVSSEKQHSLQLQLWLSIDPFCEVPATYTVHIKSVCL